jgi:hypothetical protein
MDSNTPPEFSGGASGMMLAEFGADERVTFEGGIISSSYRLVIVAIRTSPPRRLSGANGHNASLLLLHRRQEFFDRSCAPGQINGAMIRNLAFVSLWRSLLFRAHE